MERDDFERLRVQLVAEFLVSFELKKGRRLYVLPAITVGDR